ncbi:MAG TPA: CocE/NonD family hydrolase, partial [Candidatus Thermoplasmatota archaeon]|nr:CocE/NonD family hydrolase [Candidatus Thermoplasmatota archaeon]
MRLPFRPMLAAALVAVFVAGCSAPALQEQQPVDPQPREPGGALATYLHGLSERDERVRFADARLEQHRIPAEDGVELDTWVAVPPGEGPFPVVLRITPYYAGGPPAGLGRLGEELLGRGYAVALSTVRGTGTSGGCFHQGSEQEARDGAAVVEALAALPWSNGNVGMVGVSYDGTTPQNVWLESPPALKTIVPISGISDFYKYNFVNGVPIVIQGFGFNAYYWLFEDALFDMGGPGSQDPREVVHALQGAACAEQVDVQLGGATSTATGDKNAYWQSRDLVARLAARVEEGRPPAASVLYVHGLQDWNVKPHHMEDWLQAVQATGVPFKAMLGQWGHAWPQATARDARCMPDADGVAACRTDWWDQVLVAWFDQFLKGKETGILDAPAVQVQDDDGVWRHEDAWPPADARWHGLRLAAAGRLVAEGDAPRATVSWVDGSHAVTTLPR